MNDQTEEVTVSAETLETLIEEAEETREMINDEEWHESSTGQSLKHHIEQGKTALQELKNREPNVDSGEQEVAVVKQSNRANIYAELTINSEGVGASLYEDDGEVATVVDETWITRTEIEDIRPEHETFHLEQNLPEEGTSDDTLYLDEENEIYGYGIYNTHTNQLLTLPAAVLNNSVTSTTNQNHLTSDPDENMLEEIADHYNLNNVSHLRVVTVRLNNELDRKAAKVAV